MISVLICSKNELLLNAVRKNIELTIGVQYEILAFDNSSKCLGICKVYNQLAYEAKYPLLCFIHEDVIFKTNNWGAKLCATFRDKQVGLVGIAGAKFKSQYFSGWFTNNRQMDCARYIHQYPDYMEQVVLNPEPGTLHQEVVCIDGVFMCCTKEVWETLRFDERIKGFHFYDIDFSLNVSGQFKVLVVFDIELVHITQGGDYGNTWVEASIEYHKSFKSELPFSKWKIPYGKMNRRVVLGYLDFLKNFDISFQNKLKWILYQSLHSKPLYYVSILKFLFYKPLGLKRIFRR